VALVPRRMAKEKINHLLALLGELPVT